MDKFKSFIDLINKINGFLNKNYDLDEKTTFGQALIHTKDKNNIIRIYFNELISYNDFRNVMIHKNITIGTPSDNAVERLKKIYNQLRAPKTIGSYIKKDDVITFNFEDTLENVLKVVNKKDYTFFPIFNNNDLYGILTSDGIIKAVSRYVDEDIIEFSDVKISSFIENDENIKNYEIVKPIDNLFDVVAIFEKSANKTSSPITLLVSDGNINESKDIRGIITYWDLEMIKKEIL